MSPWVLALLLLGQAQVAFDHSHSTWADFLDRHVIMGPDGKTSTVDYAAARADRPRLQSYLDSLAAVDRTNFDAWSDAQQLAYLINSYNAYAVDRLLSAAELPDSIRDLGSLFRPIWKQRFIPLFGEDVSLDHIEHDLIRGRFDQPLIHAGVNCASCGCPALRPEPFVAERLDEQLELAMALFLSDRSRNRVELEDRVLRVSKIFDWFEDDFMEDAGDMEPFFGRFADALGSSDAERELVRSGDYRVRFTDYDWTLNAPGRCGS